MYLHVYYDLMVIICFASMYVIKEKSGVQKSKYRDHLRIDSEASAIPVLTILVYYVWLYVALRIGLANTLEYNFIL